MLHWTHTRLRKLFIETLVYCSQDDVIDLKLHMGWYNL